MQPNMQPPPPPTLKIETLPRTLYNITAISSGFIPNCRRPLPSLLLVEEWKNWKLFLQVKKRQVMRNTFGDYRKKIAAEVKQESSKS